MLNKSTKSAPSAVSDEKVYNHNMTTLNHWMYNVAFCLDDDPQLWLDTDTQELYSVNEYSDWEEVDKFQNLDNMQLVRVFEDEPKRYIGSDVAALDKIDETVENGKEFVPEEFAEEWLQSTLQQIKDDKMWEILADYELVPTCEEAVAANWKSYVLEAAEIIEEEYDSKKEIHDHLEEEKALDRFEEETGWY